MNKTIESVSVGGESGKCARVCDFNWILSIRKQCVKADVPFLFHQTGSKFLKDDKIYSIPREMHHIQAKKANINFKIED